MKWYAMIVVTMTVLAGMRMPQPMDSLEQTILLRSKEKKVTRTKSVYRTFLSREAGETLEE